MRRIVRGAVSGRQCAGVQRAPKNQHSRLMLCEFSAVMYLARQSSSFQPGNLADRILPASACFQFGKCDRGTQPRFVEAVAEEFL